MWFLWSNLISSAPAWINFIQCIFKYNVKGGGKILFKYLLSALSLVMCHGEAYKQSRAKYHAINKKLSTDTKEKNS